LFPSAQILFPNSTKSSLLIAAVVVLLLSSPPPHPVNPTATNAVTMATTIPTDLKRSPPIDSETGTSAPTDLAAAAAV
jgi:hypothetical protein